MVNNKFLIILDCGVRGREGERDTDIEKQTETDRDRDRDREKNAQQGFDHSGFDYSGFSMHVQVKWRGRWCETQAVFDSKLCLSR